MQVKKSTAMDNMLVLHVIMWRRRWRRKRWNMWGHRRWRRKRRNMWVHRRWRRKRRNMWGHRRWRCKRRNMWGHPINIKRPEFGIFNHLCPDLLEDGEKFHGGFFLEWISSSFTVCRSWWERKYENKTPNTGGGDFTWRTTCKFFEARAIKICRRQERDCR